MSELAAGSPMGVDAVAPKSRQSAASARLARVASRHGAVLIAYAVLLVLIVVYAAVQPGVLSVAQLNLQVQAGLALVLVATGQTIVLIARGIDLSVGGVISIATCLAARHFGGAGSQILWVAVIVLAGVAAGAINGLLIVYARLEPFVATLASWAIYNGIALLILAQPGGTIPNDYTAALTGTILGIGVPVLILAVMIVGWLWFRRTPGATRLRAMGSSPGAAYLSGMSVPRTTIAAYMSSGLFAALAGLFLVTQMGGGDPLVGSSYVLQSVAAAVIGGTALSGGRGDVLGTIAGAFILSILGSVVFALNLPSPWQPIATGALFIFAAVGGALFEIRQGGRR